MSKNQRVNEGEGIDSTWAFFFSRDLGYKGIQRKEAEQGFSF